MHQAPRDDEPAQPDESNGLTDENGQRQTFTVKRDIRRRLDVVLRQRLKRISRSKIQQLIELGGVTVNGTVPKPSTIVRKGDVVDVILPAPAIRTIEPEDIPLDVLYEDDDMVVINKQADLIVHPARSHLTGRTFSTGRLLSPNPWCQVGRGACARCSIFIHCVRKLTGII